VLYLSDTGFASGTSDHTLVVAFKAITLQQGGAAGFSRSTMFSYGTDGLFSETASAVRPLGTNTPAPDTTGLYHVAIRYPSRAALAHALKRLVENKIPISGASDHGVSEAIYLNDPDGNGIELYRDRPREEWPMAPDGKGVAMVSVPLDLQSLLAEADG